MKKRLVMLLSIFLCLIMVVSAGVSADFGEFAGGDDYDYDDDSSGWGSGSSGSSGSSGWGSGSSGSSGSSGWGSGSSDWGSGSSGWVSGSSGWGSSSGSSSKNESSGSDKSFPSLFFLIVLCGIGCLVYVACELFEYLKYRWRSHGRRFSSRSTLTTAGKSSAHNDSLKRETVVGGHKLSELNSMNSYHNEVDPDFKSDEMKEFATWLYIKLQTCWCARDLEPLRPYLTDELYSKSDLQLDEYLKNEQFPHVTDINVNEVRLLGWFRSADEEHMVLKLNTCITVYTTDKDGIIVKGDQSKRKLMSYFWDMARTRSNAKSDAGAESSVSCPNCGASVDINKSAKCPFCGSVITTNEHDWVLVSITGSTQRTL